MQLIVFWRIGGAKFFDESLFGLFKTPKISCTNSQLATIANKGGSTGTVTLKKLTNNIMCNITEYYSTKYSI